MVVPEAAARGENFNVVEQADHFSICRPKNKISRGFQKLKTFLADRIADGIKVRSSGPEKYQTSPHDVSMSHGKPSHPLQNFVAIQC